ANPMYYLDNDAGRSSSAGGFGLLPGGFFYQNMLTISRMHDEYTVRAVNEKEHRVYPEMADHYLQAVQKLPRGPYTIFARMLLPAVGKAVSKSARQQFYVDATRAGCAIERFRLAKGGLPQSLEELVLGYLKAIPTDLIDGKTLKYKPDGKGGY